MDWCGKSSTVLKIAVACLFVAYILVIVGFATTNWSIVTRKLSFAGGQVEYSNEVGLWQECVCVEVMLNSCTCGERHNTPDWFKAVQALMSLAVLGLSISLVLSCLLLCVTQNRKIKIANVAIIAISGIFIVVAVILYGTQDDNFSFNLPDMFQAFRTLDTDHDYGYSYIICYIADAIIFLVCISLFIWDMRARVTDREVHVHHYHRDPYVPAYERRERSHVINAPPYAPPYVPPSYDTHHYSAYSQPRSQISYIEPHVQKTSQYGRDYRLDQPYKPRDQWSFDRVTERVSYR